ncbi:D-amino acid aminotransferase [Undibacterium sp. 14-3-2]|uniref:D-amino acid aminotransferase n=1 Tax=Undibacterium sp. 14-3-2 TaxID=2800129 RepID=UPI00190529F3|nr:D-amino acid aminotransferase [Undibacterium sp. 14-3-2]MBK1888892.1 D-amino acid aminotransferase [Undibacterium sp. 14-3-2]
MNDPLVYLNGAMTPLSEAKISVLDRGFIFGDGIYEVIPVYGRKMFRADQHLARLFRSLDAIGINNPHSKEEWLALIAKVMDAHEADDQMVYLQITRGVAKRAHAYPKDVTPTVFIMTNPIVMPSAEAREHGVACVSMEDLRWLHCEIKSISLLGNVFAAQNAAENGVTETIQFRNGYLTEASSSNVWIVKDGVLMGPPKDNQILEGIRYALIEEICAANHIPFKACRITRDEVFAADEVMLSSATKEVLAVVKLDDQTIGNGLPGPIYKQLYAAYQLAKAA